MLTEEKVKDEAIDYATRWLNRQGGDPLPDGYFTGVEVEFRTHEDEPIYLLAMLSDDDGGYARMLCYFVDEQIAWGAWYFDGTWGEMS